MVFLLLLLYFVVFGAEITFLFRPFVRPSFYVPKIAASQAKTEIGREPLLLVLSHEKKILLSTVYRTVVQNVRYFYHVPTRQISDYHHWLYNNGDMI